MNGTIRTGDNRRSRLRRVIGAFLGLATTATLLAWGAPSTASAAVTYYVDQQHPSASDSNPGTVSLPFATIQKGANVVRAGDTVLVKPGVYPERVILGPYFTGGTAAAPITFRAEPRRTVTMYGFSAHSYAKPVYVRIEGFQITEGPTGGGVSIGWPVTQGIQIVDNYFYDLKTGAVSLSGVGEFYVARNEIFQSQKGITMTGNGYVVEDNRVTRMKAWDTTLDVDFMRFFGSNGVWRRNWLGDTRLEDVGTAHLDCFQTFTIGAAVTDILIEGNTCDGAHQGVYAERQAYPNQNITVRNNLFINLGSFGLACGAKNALQIGCENFRALNNTFATVALHGIGCGWYSSCEARNNIFYNVKNPWVSYAETVRFDRSNNLFFGYGLNQKPPAMPGDIFDQDPRFVDPAGDHHLQAGSPAIDTGNTLQDFDTDYNGTLRPQGAAWDLGAYEYRQGQKLAAPGALQVIPVP